MIERDRWFEIYRRLHFLFRMLPMVMSLGTRSQAPRYSVPRRSLVMPEVRSHPVWYHVGHVSTDGYLLNGLRYTAMSREGWKRESLSRIEVNAPALLSRRT